MLQCTRHSKLQLYLYWIFKCFQFSFVEYTLKWPGTRLIPGTKGYLGQGNQPGSQIHKIMADPGILENREHETVYQPREREGKPA